MRGVYARHVIVQTLARKLNYQILNLRARQPNCVVQEFNISRGILFVSTTPNIDISYKGYISVIIVLCIFLVS